VPSIKAQQESLSAVGAEAERSIAEALPVFSWRENRRGRSIGGQFSERFLIAHPALNLLSASTDSQMIVARDFVASPARPLPPSPIIVNLHSQTFRGSASGRREEKIGLQVVERPA